MKTWLCARENLHRAICANGPLHAGRWIYVEVKRNAWWVPWQMFVPAMGARYMASERPHLIRSWRSERLTYRNIVLQLADSCDCGQGFQLIADSHSNPSRTAFR